MQQHSHKNKIVLAVALLLAVGLYWVLFQTDNKYTAALPSGYGYAVLQADTDVPAFLVDGWEYYPGQLLEPEDFASGVTPQKYTFIGEHAHFSDDLNTPYGTATYRLTLVNHGPAQQLVLYLPELLSAGRVYLNGQLVGEQGEIAPYAPRIMDGLYSFFLEDSVEIIVQCANYSHYYSGMYYAGAVGTMQSMVQMLTIRSAIYGFLCFSALTLALLYLGQWICARDRRLRWMGFLSLAYALRVCYPFLRLLGVPTVRLLYGLEDVCGNVVLLCTLLLAGDLAGAVSRWYHRKLAVFASVLLCVVSLVFPIFVLPYVPYFINIYGLILFLWKLAVAAYLLILAGRTCKLQYLSSCCLLGTAVFFALSLVVSVVLANRLEPIYGPWPEEYGGFALVAGFAAMIVQSNLRMLRENRRLTLHLQEEVDRKTHSMELLLQERRELLASVLHDLKNPLSALCSYAELVRRGGVSLDQETEHYLDALGERAGTVRERLNQLQNFSRRERGLAETQTIDLNGFLQDFYAANCPDIELSGVDFLLQLPEQQVFVRGSEERLRIALENLCYNALSFTASDGSIGLSLSVERQWAVLSVTDTGCGIAAEDLPHIFERGYTKREDFGGEGLGLFLVRAIALEHGGSVAASSQQGEGSTLTMRIPICTSREDTAKQPPQ